MSPMYGVVIIHTQVTNLANIIADMDANETLKILIEQGIVDSNSLRQAELMQLEQKVALVHNYKISQLPNGQWKTYLPASKGRKEIRAKSKEVILSKVLAFYECPSNLDNITFSKLFDEWLEYKSTITESPNTIKRHVQHYNKYLRVFGSKTIQYLDYLSLQALCNSIVKDNNLTRKEWTNVKTILKGIFEYAVEKGYSSENPISRVKIFVKYRQENRKSGKTETFNMNEYLALDRWLSEKNSEKFNPGIFAIRINFFLGLRVGELVALKWEDIEDNNLHIVREEVRNRQTGERYVAPHTKTNRDRYVPIIPDAMKILNELKPYVRGEYIFMDGTRRVSANQINYWLRKYAAEKNIITKSSHKIRKTYASKLDASGVPIDEIRALLGHSNLETTMRYLYNPLTSSETLQRVTEALSLSSNYPQEI